MQLRSVLLALVPLSAPVHAQDLSLDTLQGMVINARVNYSGMFRASKGQGPGRVTNTLTIKIGSNGAIQTSIVRDVAAETPAGTKHGSLSKNFAGTVGMPGKTTGESFVWLLEGNQLVLLRVMEVGGFKVTIRLGEAKGGPTCSIDAPYAPEVGAGAGKTTSAVFGGTAQILSMKQTSSACTVKKG